MVSALTFGLSSPSSSPDQGHCVVFLGKTLNSHIASLHRIAVNLRLGGNPAMD